MWNSSQRSLSKCDQPGGRCGVHGVGEPALVPDAAGAQHGVELVSLPVAALRIIKGDLETHAVERFLRDPLTVAGGVMPSRSYTVGVMSQTLT